MLIADALRGVRSLRDLPALVAALGHEALWEDLGPTPVPAATVGRAGDFTWLAIESDAPAADARRTARRYAAEGRAMGVLAFYRRNRELAIAASSAGVPVLHLALDHPDAVAVACLERLRGAAGSALSVAARVADALGGEGLGHAFFRAFRERLAAMASLLPPRVPAPDRHAVTLVQLTRVLFLYFVQSKGWLDGRTDFLARQVDRALSRRRQVQRDFLHPLFFGTLNRPAAERSRAATSLGAVPFLNGGLFEPHPLERRWHAVFPNAAWREAFDGLFERFHFTVSEQRRGAVAPDMLGRVFEGVMDPAERHESGTFYTPAALVARVVDAALAAAVGARLGCDDAEADERLRLRETRAVGIASGLTILDPAVGSGAFLLGALERLARLRAPDRLARAKRAILRRNLFGVDRNAMAVRLAELRLWLAVVADESADAAHVRPLPNLDCLIRQGDSLADPLPTSGVPVDAHRIGELRRRAVAATGPAKRVHFRDLAAAERRAAGHAIGQSEARVEAELRSVLEGVRAPTLFGDRPRLSPGGRKAIDGLRATLRTIRAGRRRLAREGELPWFHYQAQFPDVFATGGFGLVLGNPPWVRAEALSPAVRERLSTRYRWWRGEGGNGFAHRPDLSVAFLERGFELTAPGGTVALLVPAKLASAGYAARARAALAATATLHAVADLSGDADAGFEATTYPMALIATRRAPAPEHRVRGTLAPSGPGGAAQSGLEAGPWIVRHDHAARVSRELATRHPPLSERYRCHLGAKTGADRIFLDPPDPIEPELLRWAVRGRDVAAFGTTGRRRLLWTHDESGRPLETLPPLARGYLARHEPALRARADYAGGPPWSVFRAGPASARHRVVWPDLARRLAAAALTGRGARTLIPLNTCYVVATRRPADASLLAAWLNTTWCRNLAALVAQPAAGGYRRFGAAPVGSLPLPSSVTADADFLRLAHRMAAGEPLQEELDALAARHLGLDGAARDALAAAGHADDRR